MCDFWLMSFTSQTEEERRIKRSSTSAPFSRPEKGIKIFRRKREAAGMLTARRREMEPRLLHQSDSVSPILQARAPWRAAKLAKAARPRVV